MKLKTSPLITVIYRGSLEDTASLVGLVQSRAAIGLIAYTGDLTAETKKYIEFVNKWLKSKSVCEIKINPTLSENDLKHIVDSPCRQWNWGDQECQLALKLAGIPTPRKLSIVKNF